MGWSMCIFLMYTIFSYSALNQLRKTNPNEYENLVAERTTYSLWPSLDVQGYFLSFRYLFAGAVRLNRHYLFFLSSLSLWGLYISMITAMWSTLPE